MASARHRLLSRYLEAANTIAADWPRAKTGGGNGVPRRTEDIQASDTETDVEIDATQRLLRRQAALLASAQQHRLAEGGTSQADGVDEELLERRLADVASTATGKFYAYRYDSVPYQWRCLYTDALILSTHLHVLRSLSAHGCLGSDALDRVVETLDRALIVTGGASERLGAAWIEKTMQNLEVLCEAQERQEEEEEETGEPSAKRLKTTGGTRAPAAADHARTFSTHEPHGRPAMRADKQCPRHRGWTLDRFEAYMDQESGGEPWPVVFTDLIDDWPALTDRPWNRPAYLLSKTFGGRRLVPVEVGRSYVDEGWTQDLVPFGRFLAEHVDASLSGRPVGYLAQHDLFR
ncbi:hypothetical protein CDD83_8277 [Cordyceps sp. RAO-2017]|nr:hypothetical protein CDD83_8277 [Cordyceps sp. RAO-2017]